MGTDATAVLTIIGMALVTYLTRAGGVWLMARVKQTPRVEAWLRHIPGAVLVSLVAPSVASGGTAGAAAVAMTALVAARTRNFLLSVIVGIAVVWMLREGLGIRN